MRGRVDTKPDKVSLYNQNGESANRVGRFLIVEAVSRGKVPPMVWLYPLTLAKKGGCGKSLKLVLRILRADSLWVCPWSSVQTTYELFEWGLYDF